MSTRAGHALTAYVNGIGLLGPGFDDWRQGSAILAGRAAYVARNTVLPVPVALPAAERRRTDRVVKLALAVGFEALAQSGADADLPTVFASSGGDGQTCHEICETLASANRQLSPTRFHNSVHNAAAGYWSIATGSMRASNVLCAYDASFAAGLLEAMTQIATGQPAVLLIAYDTGYPAPLYEKRPIPDAFGTALLLGAHAGAGCVARIGVTLDSLAIATLPQPELEHLRASIPAARALPLLQLLANGCNAPIGIEYLDVSQLRVETSPCA